MSVKASITYVPSVYADSILLRVPGEPRGKGRHRAQALARGKLRTYPDPATEQAEQLVREVWRNAGARRIEGPVVAAVFGVMARPLSHFRKAGQLSAVGLRATVPLRKPDVDNLLKLVLDALAGHAYGDDALVIDARVSKRWADETEDPHTLVLLYPAPAVTPNP